LNRLPVPDIFKRAALLAMRCMGLDKKNYYEWLRRGANHESIFWGGAEVFTENQKRRLLSPRLRKKLDGLSSWEKIRPFYVSYRQKARRPSYPDWMTYLDLNMRLPELLLMKVDKMTMAVGLEIRVPFLDHKLVELAMSLPPAVRAKGLQHKYLFKKSVSEIIPRQLIDRPKQGFVLPLNDWYKQGLGPVIEKELREMSAATDFFDGKEIAGLIRRGHALGLWMLYCFALWRKQYIAG
jgi:asparagine synthase (glutamine-hydrolysing)